MAQFSFDINSVEKRESIYELLPAGWYTAQVVESEVVPLKSGNGQALKMTFEVLQEGYRNRKVWARLNVRHSTSPKAEQIAQKQLRELCEAIGVVRMQDTTELHNKPVDVKVKIRKDDTGQYEDQNEISVFRPAQGAQSAPRSATTQSAPRQAAAAPAGGGSTPPWAKA